MSNAVTMILPCAGKSTRYQNVRPKWMLTEPQGYPMVVKAAMGITGIDKIIVTILAEHDKKYDAAAGLCLAFHEAMNTSVEICILPEQTLSQADTITQTIEKMKLTKGSSIFIKDADSYFKFDIASWQNNHNLVCTSDLTTHGTVNACNKSYCITDNENVIHAVHEKNIVSTEFSAGGYLFKDAHEFARTAKEMIINFPLSEIYASHVINAMIADESVFVAAPIQSFCDWGTLDDWLRYIGRYKTYFVDIDGVLVQNAGKYFKPYRYIDQVAIDENIKMLNNLYDEGSMVILTTARPESERVSTLKQLECYGVKYDSILMGCLHAGRVLINDFSTTNPYPSATAITIPRNGSITQYLK